MKKLLIILLTACLLAGCAAGCRTASGGSSAAPSALPTQMAEKAVVLNTAQGLRAIDMNGNIFGVSLPEGVEYQEGMILENAAVSVIDGVATLLPDYPYIYGDTVIFASDESAAPAKAAGLILERNVGAVGPLSIGGFSVDSVDSALKTGKGRLDYSFTCSVTAGDCSLGLAFYDPYTGQGERTKSDIAVNVTLLGADGVWAVLAQDFRPYDEHGAVCDGYAPADNEQLVYADSEYALLHVREYFGQRYDDATEGFESEYHSKAVRVRLSDGSREVLYEGYDNLIVELRAIHGDSLMMEISGWEPYSEVYSMGVAFVQTGDGTVRYYDGCAAACYDGQTYILGIADMKAVDFDRTQTREYSVPSGALGARAVEGYYAGGLLHFSCDDGSCRWTLDPATGEIAEVK